MMTNAHLHYKDSFSYDDFTSQMVCLCAGDADEWGAASSFARAVNDSCGTRRCLVSAGVHPWSLESGETGARNRERLLWQPQKLQPDLWLEQLLKENAADVAAVGECGIDLYTQELKSLLPAQLDVFEKQVALAVRYEKPLVVHCRRSIQYFFKYRAELRKLPSVIFHAFPGTLSECESLLENGLNAFFSFGKGVLRGGKKAAECVVNLPDNRLLLETDAEEAAPALLCDVFKIASELRGVPCEKLEELCARNFCRAYCVKE